MALREAGQSAEEKDKSRSMCLDRQDVCAIIVSAMTATKEYRFYGTRWNRCRRGELPEKLYNAFVKEIISGRWRKGERLPAYEQLCRDTGISRTSLDVALTRLEDDGYIERVSKKGMFLKTPFPGKHAQIGTVALVTGMAYSSWGREEGSRRAEAFGLMEVESISNEAERIGLNLVPCTLNGNPEATAEKINTLKSEPDFRGVISMVRQPFLQRLLDTGNVPVVYLGIEDLSCVPCVSGSPFQESSMLTQHLIEKGHRRIGFFNSADRAPEVVDLLLKGHRRAMAEAGLACNEDLIELSSGIERLDVASVKRVLEASPECSALIGASLEVSRKIVETADLLRRRIPEDLSICSMQIGRMRPDSRKTFVGIRYDWHKIVTSCFDILLNRKDNCHLSRMTLNPEIGQFGLLSVMDFDGKGEAP